MFKNSLKVARRRPVKDRQFSFLNMRGLDAVVACALLIYRRVNGEFSFDKFNDKCSRLYQLMEHRRSYAGQRQFWMNHQVCPRIANPAKSLRTE